MAKIENVRAIIELLKRKQAAGKKVSVVVGFTAAYAVHVHENLESFHKVGQAKFLEQPAREMQEQLRQIAVGQLKRGRSLTQALLVAGLTLQRASQLLVPVDTGALRASAFTRKDEG